MGLFKELSDEIKWMLWDWGEEHLKDIHIDTYEKIRDFIKDED